MAFIDWDGVDTHKNDDLVRMTLAGHSRNEVAKALGITRNAVVGRVNTLRSRGVHLPPSGKKGGSVSIKPDWSALSDDERMGLLKGWSDRDATIREALAEVRGTSRTGLHSWAYNRGYSSRSMKSFSGNAVLYNLPDIRRQKEARILADREAAKHAEAPNNAPVSIMDVEDHHCRFVVGKGMFCGAPTEGVRLQPWCPYHRAIVYTPVEKRKTA